MKVIADHREAPSGVIREIHRLDLEIDLQQLDVGDFILSDHVGVERKTASDFLQSLVDGRLLEQTKSLAETFEKPLLVLEGGELYTKRAIHPNAIRGALACITVDYGIPIIFTQDESDTAELIKSITKREQEDKEREVSIRNKDKSFSLRELQRFVTEGLPGVSAVLAKRLLAHFGSVRKVMSASKEELKEVQGIGDGKAEEIIRIMDAEYVPENCEDEK